MRTVDRPYPHRGLHWEAEMLKKIVFAVAVFAVLFAVTAGAATPKSKDYVYVFTSDPRSFNYLNDQRATNTQHVVNFIDGLIEHDKYGILRPAVAESWTSNADFTVWTFN